MRMGFVITAAFALALGSAAPALAAGQQQCRDSNGKFMKCPPPPPPTASRCRDNASGKFVKCGTPGSTPVNSTKH